MYGKIIKDKIEWIYIAANLSLSLFENRDLSNDYISQDILHKMKYIRLIFMWVLNEDTR